MILALLALTAVACGHAAERRLLTQFFAASRLRDLTALSKLATVVFEPLSDGVVTDFDITAVTSSTKPDVKTVSIAAPVRLPDGRTIEKAFDVTVERQMVTKVSERLDRRPSSPQAVPSTPRP
jgi:hypothetical protein